MHYSAGSSLSGAITALKNRGLSYNFLIDKDGSIHQARPFNRRSSHAGRSNWKADGGLKNASSLNGSSIGISLINLGLHDFFKHGKWWHGIKKGKVQPPSVAAASANNLSSIYAPRRQPHWEPYTSAQISSCRALIDGILNEYDTIDEIIGHDDIAIDDKFDPGPALPVQKWREEFGMEGSLGLAANVDSPDGELNMRDRPIHRGGQVIKVLKQGDQVHIRSVTYASRKSSATLISPSKGRALTGWASVDIDGSNKHAGFVYMGFLTDTPLSSAFEAQL